jgi:hypothetical protein
MGAILGKPTAPDLVATGSTARTIDPRAFGLVKAAYTVSATLDLLSIGRTSLYAAVKRGDLHPVKFGRKTLFYAADLAAFLNKLSNVGDHSPAPEKYGDR